MSRFARAIDLLVLLAGALVVMPGASTAEVSVNVSIGPPPPIVLVAPPPLVIVPGVPVVSYVPSTQVDRFFFDKRWYYPYGGHWFVGPTYKGPWTYVAVGKLPRSIVVVPVRYYKVPPGHLKKLESGGPPGHAKRKGQGHP
jgi:hypothetical protein